MWPRSIRTDDIVPLVSTDTPVRVYVRLSFAYKGAFVPRSLRLREVRRAGYEFAETSGG